MPKKGKRKNKKGFSSVNSRKSNGDVVQFHGRLMGTISVASQVAGLDLNPQNFDNRLIAVSDAYQEFRFDRLSAILFRQDNDQATIQNGPTYVIGYSETFLPSTSYPSLDGLVESCASMALGQGDFGFGWPRINVNRNLLHGSIPKWFTRAVGGTVGSDNLEAYQGTLLFGTFASAFNATGAGTATLVVDYSVSLRSPMVTGSTPQAHRVIQFKGGQQDQVVRDPVLADLPQGVGSFKPTKFGQVQAAASTRPSQLLAQSTSARSWELVQGDEKE